MKTYHYIIPIACYICLGCYSTTEVKLPNEDSFLVVNSINFQTDSVWFIEVTKSQPIMNDNIYASVDNAQVSIKDENGLVLNLEPVALNNWTYYKSDVKPVANKQYEITVTAPGMPTVKANSTLPKPVDILKVEIDSTYLKEVIELLKQDPNYAVDYKKAVPCSVTFSDPPGEKNFYDLKGYFQYSTSKEDEDGELVFTPHIRSLYINDENGFSQNFLMADTEFNGTTHVINFNISIAVFLAKVDCLYISLQTLNSAYFNYLHTYDLQNTATVDPFAQPVIVFGNIKNGAGLFAGFSTSVWTLNRE